MTKFFPIKIFWVYILLISFNLLCFYHNVAYSSLYGLEGMNLFLMELNIFAVAFLVFFFQKIYHNNEIDQLKNKMANDIYQLKNKIGELESFKYTTLTEEYNKIAANANANANANVQPIEQPKEQEIERPKTYSAIQFMDINK